jgi:F0F1-type ATP synthase assembly protein I
VGKLAGTAVGAAIGRTAHKSPWAPLVGALVGIVAGEVVDRTIMPRCPTCRTVLQLIGTAIT